MSRSRAEIVDILAPIVAEITACGYCDGSCGSCQEDANKLADALQPDQSTRT